MSSVKMTENDCSDSRSLGLATIKGISATSYFLLSKKVHRTKLAYHKSQFPKAKKRIQYQVCPHQRQKSVCF